MHFTTKVFLEFSILHEKILQQVQKIAWNQKITKLIKLNLDCRHIMPQNTESVSTSGNT